MVTRTFLARPTWGGGRPVRRRWAARVAASAHRRSRRRHGPSVPPL